MRGRDFMIATFTVFGTHQLLGFLLGWVIFGVAMADSLGAIPSETAQRMWALPASGLVWAVVFVQLFRMIRKEGSIQEGLTFGFWVGVVVALPAATNAYVYTPGEAAVPVTTSVFLISVVQGLVCGVALAGVCRSRQVSG